MLNKCVVVWITSSVILASGTTSTDRLENRVGGRIYVPGGRPVQPGEFPFLVMLEFDRYNRKMLCSGSIPSPTTVLTCAHCNGRNITAYAGLVSDKEKELRNGRVQVRSVQSKVKHKKSLAYDVMVCYVNQPWVWTEFVAPVALHLSDKSLRPAFAVPCQVTGFGETERGGEPGVAHVMDQLVGSSAHCMDRDFAFVFLSCYMCSLNVDNKTICTGDGGGPALCGGKQWGINRAFIGKELFSLPVCLPPKVANQYMYLGYFRKWIRNNIKDLPPSAYSSQCLSVKISISEALLYQPLWLTLITTIQLFYLH